MNRKADISDLLADSSLWKPGFYEDYINGKASEVLNDIIRTTWMNGIVYRELRKIIDSHNLISVDGITYCHEFRVRNIIFSLKNPSEPKFLTMKKHSREGVNFYELIKGGFEYDKDSGLMDSSSRELKEEAANKSRLIQKPAIAVYADINTPTRYNSDILLRDREIDVEGIKQKIKRFDLITNMLYLALSEFNPLIEKGSPEEEHIYYQWATKVELEKMLRQSAQLGFNRDYIFFEKFIAKFDFKELEKIRSKVGRYRRIIVS